ncbi:MAG TPA: DUF4360 domain-containing protein [Pilimelia sp.]|nr:DUF4360 domain-containing protein [Pilimelia sp.]
MRTIVHAAAAGALAAAALTAAAPPAHARPTEPPAISLRLLGFGGTGCPSSEPDATRVAIDPDGGFSASYTRFTARGTGGAAPAQSTCSLHFDVAVPPGYQVAVTGAEYSGTASLTDRGTAQVSSKYFWQGTASTTFATPTTLAGPQQDAWIDSHGIADFWSPRCGGPASFVMTQSLSVLGGEADVATVESAGSGPAVGWDLAARPCTR